MGGRTVREKGLPPTLREKLRISVRDMHALSRVSGERSSGAHGQDKPGPDENPGQAILGALSLI